MGTNWIYSITTDWDHGTVKFFWKIKAAVISGQAAVISGLDRIGNVQTLLTNLPGRFVNNVCTLLKIWNGLRGTIFSGLDHRNNYYVATQQQVLCT